MKAMNCLSRSSLLSFKFSTLFLIFAFLCQSAKTQDLLSSRRTSYYTYIYELSDKQAKSLYKNGLQKVTREYFHTLVDSFPTDSIFQKPLPQGHYLKSYAEKNQQKFAITTVQDFEVYLLNNNTDLSVRVYNLTGSIIDGADVRIGLKNLKFDDQTKTYTDRKSNRKGLLKVSYGGFTAYHDLDRQYNNSFFRRGARKVIYGTPVKYIWVPVKFVVFVPIDGVRSVVRRWPQGTINKTKNFFINAYHSVACMFDSYYCDYHNKFSEKHSGYLVFSKPKYQPGDTVKFKAFVTKNNGRPINKKVNIALYGYRKYIALTNLQPYRKGGYEYAFFLHDTLELKLDRNYTISVETRRGKEYITGSFRYEDYELSKTKLTMKMDEDHHYRGHAAKIRVKGTDENDLNLLDGRLEVLITPKNIHHYYENRVFIPDTLLVMEKQLEPTDETVITISDTIFSKANLDYEVLVRLITSDNEIISQKKKTTFFHESKKFNLTLINDSIELDYRVNGRSEKIEVQVTANDNFGHQTPLPAGITPYRTALNPYFSSYTIKADGLSETLQLTSEPSLIQCLSQRTTDSVIIVVDNPRQIPFTYYIYKRNHHQKSGYTSNLNLQQKANTKQNYFVMLRYLWAGQVQEENYRIPLLDKKLSVEVVQPKIVYPGQKTRVEVKVTDIDGSPVEGVDVTAFSMTKKFGYKPPAVPYLGKSRKNKSVINNFSFHHFNNENRSIELDYDVWKSLAQLDSIEYYKFLYPESSIYRHTYVTPDSITQFAPFVITDGIIDPVHVVYVDNKPVYFSWSNHSNPYSFRIASGNHQIKLRTASKKITIDDYYFTQGKKHIISLSDDLNAKNVQIEEVKPTLSEHEKRILYKYIFPYRYSFGEHFAFLQQQNNIHFLKPQYQRHSATYLAGPVYGNLTFHLLDSYHIDFKHEPQFEYNFNPGLLKMRCAKKYLYPVYLNNSLAAPSLSESVLTRKKIYEQWDNYLAQKRFLTARYHNPTSTKSSAGRLITEIEKSSEHDPVMPLNLLVFKHDDPEFLRVYPGSTTMIHNLQPGYYQLVLFFKDLVYQRIDSVEIRSGGLTYQRISQTEAMTKDSFSIRVNEIIEEALFTNPLPSFREKREEMRQMHNSYQKQFQYTGEGYHVEGFVYDEADNMPLPGVNVFVKGTTYGTVTNIDGYYSLKVPSGNNQLSFAYIGFKPLDITINDNRNVDVYLEGDVMALEEVVVVGYGTHRKTDLSASVATVTSHNFTGSLQGTVSGVLQGRVAGVSINSTGGTPGSNVQISIRGASTISFDNAPLYIINGNVYNGDISELDEELIKSIEILKDSAAVSIYGARGANGVVIIEADDDNFKAAAPLKNKGATYDEAFLTGISEAKSIRENFSDEAFWQPQLTTNQNGKAWFEVTFPDDVTSWKTYYLAMNENRQSGQAEGTIKSYKPLMAQLAVPRFLVQSDTTYAIGKVLNYTPDSVNVTTLFEVNQQMVNRKSTTCVNALLDTLEITAGSDSLEVKYVMEKEDGYKDGELRKIPVFPQGLLEKKGRFFVLDGDTSMDLTFYPELGEVTLYARADVLNIIRDEIKHVMNYRYMCNEQMASKLKVLLAQKRIADYLEEKFTKENDIKRLIRLLQKNQKSNGFWGWWKNSPNSEWISLHVLEALSLAEESGYETSINKNELAETLLWELENTNQVVRRLRILKILKLMNAQITYKTYINDLEKNDSLSFSEFLEVTSLKQKCNLPVDTDTLFSFQQSTLFGSIYFTRDSTKSTLLANEIQHTLSVYRILINDSADHNFTLQKMRNYFFEKRQEGYWTNTYESAGIIETILPDILGESAEINKPNLKITGDINKNFTAFPFEMKMNPEDQVSIIKSGNFPVYLTHYQETWNPAPVATKGDFEVVSRFSNNSLHLQAGQEVKLIVDVTVKSDADYVMVNVPVPAGCSYADKRPNYRVESHREYFRHETAIFCEKLSKGSYTFEIDLLPRYSGTYMLNPAKVELMYFPTFNANERMKQVKIR